MTAESPLVTRQAHPNDSMDVRAIAAQLRLELARFEAALARAEVERLQEQLAWERAWRRRGLLGRLF